MHYMSMYYNFPPSGLKHKYAPIFVQKPSATKLFPALQSLLLLILVPSTESFSYLWTSLPLRYHVHLYSFVFLI